MGRPSYSTKQLSQDEIYSRWLIEPMVAIMMEAYQASPSLWAHVGRVARNAVVFGQSAGLSGEDLLSLQCAALLHEVGKALVDPALIGKETELERDEWYRITKHTILLLNKLKQYALPGSTLRIAQSHSERFDGKGYPQGLVGAEIPMGARVLSIAEALESMASDRPYRAAYEPARLLAEFSIGAGTQFDPDLLRTVWKLLELGAEPKPPIGRVRLITKDSELFRQIWVAVTPHGWEVQLWPEALESAYPAELAPGPATSANDTTITIVDKRYVGQLPAEVLASLPEESVWIGTHSKSQPTLDLPLDLRDIMALLYANTREDWLSGTEPKIRIILADPYHVFRQGIRRYLDGLDDAEVVAEVSTPQAFRGAITQKNFDMVIVASDLLSGTHTTSPLNAGDLRLEQAQVVSGPLYPQPTIVLVADEDVEDYNVGLYDAPLPGNISKFVYIHRGAPVERLVVAIRVMTKSQEGT